MPIFANTSSSSSITLTQPLENNQFLVYNSSLGKFTNISPPNILTGVTDGKNLNNDNYFKIFNNKTGTILNFNTLSSGAGISLSYDNNNIKISTNTIDNVSVSGDYRIIIDNDNNKQDAVLQLLTADGINEPPIIILPVTLPELFVNNLFTAVNDEKAIIYTSSVDFIALGYKKGMLLKLENIPEQDGIYQIDEVINYIYNGVNFSKIIFNSNFLGNGLFNLGGPKQNTVKITQISLFSPRIENIGPGYDNNKNYVLRVYDYDFGPDSINIMSTMQIEISGTGTIDGRYIVNSVLPKVSDEEWTGLLFIPETPLNINGPIMLNTNSIVKIEIKNYIKPTGFAVRKDGTVWGNRFICTDATSDMEQYSNDHLINKGYLNLRLVDYVNKEYYNNEIKLLKERSSKASRYYFSNL